MRLKTLAAGVGTGILAACAPMPITAPVPVPVPVPTLTMAQVLEQSIAADWRQPDPANTLYLELKSGRVLIELAPDFAPKHVANIRTLVRQKYFDGLAVLRVHENYVVQWGDADDKRPLGTASARLPGEYFRSIGELPFSPMPDGDVYAPQAGYSKGFPAGRDPTSGTTWLAHCYGMVGAGRDVAPDSGNGSGLYVVIGHSPRHLDRNVTLVGRVLKGMELLTALPRGTGALGFYDKPKQRVPIRAIRLAADVPERQREKIEVLRTDTPTFAKLVEARRFRREEWFLDPAGRIELCNVPQVVRAAP